MYPGSDLPLAAFVLVGTFYIV